MTETNYESPEHVCTNGARKTISREDCLLCLQAFRRRYKNSLGEISPEQTDKFVVWLDAELQDAKRDRDYWMKEAGLRVTRGNAWLVVFLGFTIGLVLGFLMGGGLQ